MKRARGDIFKRLGRTRATGVLPFPERNGPVVLTSLHHTGGASRRLTLLSTLRSARTLGWPRPAGRSCLTLPCFKQPGQGTRALCGGGDICRPAVATRQIE